MTPAIWPASHQFFLSLEASSKPPLVTISTNSVWTLTLLLPACQRVPGRACHGSLLDLVSGHLRSAIKHAIRRPTQIRRRMELTFPGHRSAVSSPRSAVRPRRRARWPSSFSPAPSVVHVTVTFCGRLVVVHVITRAGRSKCFDHQKINACARDNNSLTGKSERLKPLASLGLAQP